MRIHGAASKPFVCSLGHQLYFLIDRGLLTRLLEVVHSIKTTWPPALQNINLIYLVRNVKPRIALIARLLAWIINIDLLRPSLTAIARITQILSWFTLLPDSLALDRLVVFSIIIFVKYSRLTITRVIILIN